MKAAMVGIAVVSALVGLGCLMLAVIIFAKAQSVLQEQAALQLGTMSALAFVAMVVALGALTPREWVR